MLEEPVLAPSQGGRGSIRCGGVEAAIVGLVWEVKTGQPNPFFS